MTGSSLRVVNRQQSPKLGSNSQAGLKREETTLPGRICDVGNASRITAALIYSGSPADGNVYRAMIN